MSLGSRRSFERGGDLFGESDVIVELPNRQEPGVAGQGCRGNLDLDGPRRQKIEGKERDRL